MNHNHLKSTMVPLPGDRRPGYSATDNIWFSSPAPVSRRSTRKIRREIFFIVPAIATIAAVILSVTIWSVFIH